MTTATTKTRQRRAKATATALIPRGQYLIDQGADFLILSARMAETPEPRFWAEGELDARTGSAIPEDAGYDENYRAVFGDDPWWDWNWYRDALLADELAAKVPVVTLTVAVDDDPELTARVNALMNTAVKKFPGEGWAAAPVDVPGPDEDASESASSAVLPPDGAPGPGTPTDDPALD